MCESGIYTFISYFLYPFQALTFTQLQFLVFELLMLINFVLYESFYAAYLILCVCFSYDLHLTIKNPLYPSYKRMRWYLLWVIIGLLSLYTIELGIVDLKTYKLKDLTQSLDDSTITLENLKMTNKWKIFLLVPLSLLFFIGTYSCIKAWLSLYTPGLGQEVRKQVITRQIFFVIVVLLCNSPSVIVEAISLIKVIYLKVNISESSIRELNFVDLWILQPLQFMSSLFLMFSICYEPYTLILIKYNFCPQQKVKKSVKDKIRGVRNLSSYF